MVKDIQMGNRFTLFAGSAQSLANGNTVIGWAASTDAVASEVDADGNLLWELVAEGSPRYFTYRAFKTEVPDHQAPRVSVAVPAEGAVFAQGAVVEPSVACTDRGGATLRTCASSTVDTSTPGTHTFTVVASDGVGNQTSVQRTYAVLSPAPTQPPPGTEPPPAIVPTPRRT